MKSKFYNIFTPIDFIFVAWHIIVLIIITLRIYPVDNVNWIYTYYSLIIVSSLSFFYSTRDVKTDNSFFMLIRYGYAPLFLIVAFSQIELVNLMFFDRYLDPFFIRLEESVFGMQPCLTFWEAIPNRIFSEYMHMSYFLYYPTFFFVTLYPFFKRDLETFIRSVFIITFSFLFFYLLYIILPVLGPRPAIPETADIPRNGCFFAWVMVQIYKVGGNVGAAFPSSHCGMSVVTALLVFRSIKFFRVPALIITISICMATVYCRYHYVVDSVAGVAGGFLTFYLSDYLYSKMKSLGFKSYLKAD